MWFFYLMFFCNLLIPLVMLLGGYFMYKNPPKEINGIIGYRTKMSSKNKDTWDFAHDFCGRLWLKLGLIMLIVSVPTQIPFAHSTDYVIGIMTAVVEVIQLVVLLGSIGVVEVALKKKFYKNGNRKDYA